MRTSGILAIAFAIFVTSPVLAKTQPVVGIAGIQLAAQNIACRRGSHCHQQLREGFRVMLETAVVKSRKMGVYERARLDAVLAEQQLGQMGVTRSGGRVGGLTGVDYLVYGTITKFGAQRTGFRFSNTGVFGGRFGQALGSGLADSSATIHMAVDLKVTDVSSGRIVVADSVEGSVEHGKAFSIGGIRSAQTSADPYADVQRVVAAKIAEAIVTSRIPIKVIAVQKVGVIVLNYGNVFLKEGDVLSVFDVGERFIDPDTKEVLGAEESLRGSIKVTSTYPKFSKAQFVGQPFSVVRGDIVRRPSMTEAPVEQPRGPAPVRRGKLTRPLGKVTATRFRLSSDGRRWAPMSQLGVPALISRRQASKSRRPSRVPAISNGGPALPYA